MDGPLGLSVLGIIEVGQLLLELWNYVFQVVKSKKEVAAGVEKTPIVTLQVEKEDTKSCTVQFSGTVTFPRPKCSGNYRKFRGFTVIYGQPPIVKHAVRRRFRQHLVRGNKIPVIYL